MDRLPEFSTRLHGILKPLAIVILPGFGIAYMALAETWGLPWGPEVRDTCMIAEAFIGSLLTISTSFHFSNVNTDRAAGPVPYANEEKGNTYGGEDDGDGP